MQVHKFSFDHIMRYFFAIFLLTVVQDKAFGKAQEQADIENVPVAEQVPVLLYALNNHKLNKPIPGGTFLVLIVYPADCASETMTVVKSAFEAHAGKKVGCKEIQFDTVVFQSKKQLGNEIDKQNASAVYITQGNESNIRSILGVTKSAKIMSIAGDYGYVHWHGASLGVERVAGKNKILVSLTGCKNEGVVFDARLLRIASVFF